MARTELESKKQKRKAKKRKHASSDDEVANKSLIVEQQQPVQESETQTETKAEQTARKGKASKRRQQQEISAIKEKRSKQTNDSKEEAAEENEVVGEGEEMPTAEQLEEAAKPENSNAVVTVRQKKKQKHLQRLEAQKDQNADKEAKRNEEYLKKWRDNRQDWKFEKLRQISIQQTAFDDQKLSEDIWEIALEYLASSKGAAKAILTKLAEDVIQELDKQCDQLSEDADRKTIVESTRYQRARNLLQSFD
ncbi:uncharacterized protein C7orf50 homolog isoform X2 [Drosophila innubila]|uniref:uncharacterized protein C7orf50 homolog isoform X2 n=1 Tax=Drosophila innubila TaxID=198719 RepID=UPI00148C70B6|nr:uncharacterized protein C7orf50 homolog isoform X2 [Drosophila innubila]